MKKHYFQANVQKFLKNIYYWLEIGTISISFIYMQHVSSESLYSSIYWDKTARDQKELKKRLKLILKTSGAIFRQQN